MIMFPSNHQQNLIKNNSLGGYGVSSCGYYDCLINKLSGIEVGGSEIMADDESRTEFSNSNIDQEDVTGTSSSKDIIIHQETINKKEDEDNDRGWLQLSLGSGHDVHSNRPSSDNDQRSSVARSIELDLLTTTGGSASSSSGGGGGGGGGDETWSLTLTAPSQQQPNFQVPDFEARSFYLQPHPDAVAAIAFTHHQQYEKNYMPIRPYPLATLSSTPSTSSPSLEQLPLASGRPLYFHHIPQIRMDLRVVDPPRRPHSGVWFILQSSQNQIKEPFLPQVPKSYLRIKDGRTTVRLLLKYLVKKLKLHSECEIGITCKGQQLLPFLTLQHVRDHIWNRPRNDVVFPHFSATVDHLMVLHYGRIALRPTPTFSV